MVRTISLLLHGATAIILLHFLLLLAFRTLLLAKCLNLRVRHAHTPLPLRLDRVIRLLLGNIHHPADAGAFPPSSSGCYGLPPRAQNMPRIPSAPEFGIMGVFSPFSDKESGPASLLTAGS
ncbi:hypothetical protein EDB89DRAFT_1901839 [Lactarius sanguifluus]|nr:hypothetical protein EDB89DRAFT_1901839 [Lactarius sanguifluus]